jgi:hypothetical protein
VMGQFADLVWWLYMNVAESMTQAQNCLEILGHFNKIPLWRHCALAMPGWLLLIKLSMKVIG